MRFGNYKNDDYLLTNFYFDFSIQCILGIQENGIKDRSVSPTKKKIKHKQIEKGKEEPCLQNLTLSNHMGQEEDF